MRYGEEAEETSEITHPDAWEERWGKMKGREKGGVKSGRGRQGSDERKGKVEVTKNVELKGR